MAPILQNFEVVSGQRINLSECGLAGINVEDSIVGDLAEMTNCEVLQNPRAESFWVPW